MLESLVASASSYSGDIDFLFTLIAVVVGIWFILVEAIIFYFIFRFRRKKGIKAQYIEGENHKETKWIHWPHYAVIACDILIIVFTLKIWFDIKQDLPPAEESIKVVGQQWSWLFTYPGADGKLGTADDITTENELHVKVDTIYHFHLESKDVLHSFSIPVFRLKQDAVPGRIITGWFKPTKIGVHDIQCAEMCGVGHGVMGARITIETADQYTQWMDGLIQKNSADTAIAQMIENQ